MAHSYHKAALGGTFDHFHKGHEHLIKTALQEAKSVVIGITSPELSQNKELAQQIEPLEKRIKNVSNYVSHQDASNKSSIVILSNPIGPTITDPSIDILVVSEQTKSGVEQVQKARSLQGLPNLPVSVASMVTDEVGMHLSSTRIRNGLTDRSGFVFANMFQADLKINPKKLGQLKEPQGELHKDSTSLAPLLQQATHVSLVGDKATQAFINSALAFNLAVIDHQSNRQPFHIHWKEHKPKTSSTASNPPGSISQNASLLLIDSLKNDSMLVEIRGEEDLLAFPLILNAPLGSVVVYGQPNLGLVTIKVTEESKQHFKNVLSKLI